MSEIFVEEENTVYEVDTKCLEEKEKQKAEKEKEIKKCYKSQEMGCHKNLCIILILCRLCMK